MLSTGPHCVSTPTCTASPTAWAGFTPKHRTRRRKRWRRLFPASSGQGVIDCSCSMGERSVHRASPSAAHVPYAPGVHMVWTLGPRRGRLPTATETIRSGSGSPKSKRIAGGLGGPSMRRVLVPLDGTDLAAAILPDAFRLAGHDGELILIRHVADVHDGGHSVVDAAQLYLNTVAQTLRAEGIHVRTQPLVSEDAAVAIDEAAQRFNADMIAVATHGRTAAERWHEGSIAWRALLRSTVPVLIRHVDPYNPFDETPKIEHRRIMVPLDGSELAENALPLAQELARAWSASTWLVRAVEGSPADAPSARDSLDVGNRAGAEVYLSGIAGRLSGDIHSTVLEG